MAGDLPHLLHCMFLKCFHFFLNWKKKKKKKIYKLKPELEECLETFPSMQQVDSHRGMGLEFWASLRGSQFWQGGVTRHPCHPLR